LPNKPRIIFQLMLAWEILNEILWGDMHSTDVQIHARFVKKVLKKTERCRIPSLRA
jgi:hypothetical protein